MSDKRDFDILVWGATGITGKMVVEYLLSRVDRNEQPWAMAARNESKLAAVKKDLSAKYPDVDNVPHLIGNSENLEELTAMTSRARAVIACVGPFAKYGEPMVQACLATSTQYLDITGEPAFIKMLTDKYDQEASEKGVVVMPCTGIDCVPADTGVMYNLAQFKKKDPEAELVQVQTIVSAKNQTLSHGTYQTLIESFANFGKAGGNKKKGDKKKAKKAKNPNIKPLNRGIHYNKLVKGWVVPFPTADPHIVRLTAQQSGHYTDDFQHGHFLKLSLWNMVLFAITGLLFSILTRFSFTRNLLKKYKKSGDGPSVEQRKTAKFQFTVVGHGYGDGEAAKKRGKLDTEIITEMNLGECYFETAIQAVECTLRLLRVQDGEEVNWIPEKSVGVVTPGSFFGDDLVQDLVNAGQQFKVVKTGSL